MWRRSLRALSSCFVFVARCGRPASSVDGDFAEILENLYNDADDIPVYLGPHLPRDYHDPEPEPEAVRPRRGPCLHRPHAIGGRGSPPEIVAKVRRALEEICGVDPGIGVGLGCRPERFAASATSRRESDRGCRGGDGDEPYLRTLSIRVLRVDDRGEDDRGEEDVVDDVD